MITIKKNAQNSVASSAQVDVVPTKENVNYEKDYMFTNLNAFGIDPENRPSEVDDITVKKYAKQMLAGKWFFELTPIYVGINSLNVFNGEHRRKAINLAIEKGLKPIIHVRFFDDTENLKAKREALNGGRHWNSDDYVEALISAGNEDFAFLKKFCLDEDHPQLHSIKGKPYYNKGAIVLGSTYKDFKDGYLTGCWNISMEDISTCEKRYSELVRIRKSLGYDTAGQDCWIYVGEAWCKFTREKGYMERLKRLPNNYEDFYLALKYVNNTNSNKTWEWYNRFVEALEKAERHS